jgi:hypothetical protein
MKITLKYLVILVIITSCSNLTTKEISDSERVKDEDIYMIIKMVINDSKPTEILDGTKDYYILDELQPPEHFNIANKNNYFTDEDFKFIQKQLDERKNMKLIQDSIYPKQLLSSEIIDSISSIVNKEGSDRKNNFIKKYTKKFGDNDYITYSLPLFSKNKKTVYIEQSSIFGGHVIICRKENGKWKFYFPNAWT